MFPRIRHRLPTARRDHAFIFLPRATTTSDDDDGDGDGESPSSADDAVSCDDDDDDDDDDDASDGQRGEGRIRRKEEAIITVVEFFEEIERSIRSQRRRGRRVDEPVLGVLRRGWWQ